MTVPSRSRIYFMDDYERAFERVREEVEQDLTGDGPTDRAIIEATAERLGLPGVKAAAKSISELDTVKEIGRVNTFEKDIEEDRLQPKTRDDVIREAEARGIDEIRAQEVYGRVKGEILQNARVAARGRHIEARRDRFRNLERDDPGFVRGLLARKRNKAKFLQDFYELEQNEAEQAADKFN